MQQEITIKDVAKKRVVCLEGQDFSDAKALGMVTKISVWLAEQGSSIADLPLAIIQKDKTFKVCFPIEDQKLKASQEFKIETLAGHRVGSFFHKVFKKPLSQTQSYLERQLKYEGYDLNYPYRYVFHQNIEKNEPLIEIQIPIHK
jgi:hypothetical protein